VKSAEEIQLIPDAHTRLSQKWSFWEWAWAVHRRWWHCIIWLCKPWRWGKEMHMGIDALQQYDSGNGLMIGCYCGRVFWLVGPKGALDAVRSRNSKAG
jgi:hypothetical protein